MGFIPLLIVALIAVAVVFGFNHSSDNGPVEDTVTGYEQAIEDAETVVQKIEERNGGAGPVSGTRIDLSNQNLSSVPIGIFDRTNSTELDVSGNHLSGSLQAEVRHLANLRVLDLSDNNFTGVPAEIGQLSKLEILNLSGNPVTGLPLELGNLKNLRVLDLRNTEYSAFDLDIIRENLPSSVTIYTE